MKKTLCALMLLSLSESGQAFQFQTAAVNSCKLPRANCLAHYKAGCHSDGVFPIRNGAAIANAFCDMTTDGGAWMRLNSNFATSTIAFGANDAINGTNVGQGCGGPTYNFTVSGISFSHTQVKYILTRGATIIQCADLSGFSSTSFSYFSGGTWNSYSGMCTWSNPWTQSGSSSDLTTTGLPSLWKVIGPNVSASLGFRSMCSNAGDNGTYSVQIFIK